MGRLIIVSNRLPFTVRVKNDVPAFTESSGGLVSGLGAYLDAVVGTPLQSMEHIWIGWPGSTIDKRFHESVRQRALEEFHSYPVFLSEVEMDHFYHGFCNKTIWPLFHYFPSYTEYHEEFWQNYRHVNQIFSDTLASIVRPDDIVWIHDYHLMLLPRLLKTGLPYQVPVGFFLHVPFPSFEIFRLLPQRWRSEILEGLLGAQLIGFHTYEYTQHFLRSALRILGYEHHMGQITLKDHIVKVETYPMGIDFRKFHDAGHSEEVEDEKAHLRASLGDARVILSVDRLDYSKGILNRLEGFELLLQSHPEVRGTVVLVMVVVPSRIGVEQYEFMKKQVEELVGRINGEFGSVAWTPVIYQYRQVSFTSLVALYAASDVALVTPLRDGMNLIAKEYIAARAHATGVLILSEMAGASKELGEAIIINPNDRREITEALQIALEMPAEEQKRRNLIMQERLRRYDVIRWATEFVDQLGGMGKIEEEFNARLISSAGQRRIVDAYRKATRRLLLMDYDGTLSPLASRPSLAQPNESLFELLHSLIRDPANRLVVISGRERHTLGRWLGKLKLGLVAEHGIWLREPEGEWQMVKEMHDEWKHHVRPILELYADRLPGAHVEEKDFSLAWHYRLADPEQARQLAAELTDHIQDFTANINIQVMQGKKVVEVRTAGVNKGTAALHWLGAQSYDFVLCMGDDWTDEDMFAVVPDHAITLRVGMTNTRARYNLRDTHEALRFLALFTEAPIGTPTPGVRVQP